jgi:hypothetical protein
MAGLSFLYSFFNLYTTGGGQGVPTVEEAMMDIESCMAVLEYLTRKSLPFQRCQPSLVISSRSSWSHDGSAHTLLFPQHIHQEEGSPSSSPRDHKDLTCFSLCQNERSLTTSPSSLRGRMSRHNASCLIDNPGSDSETRPTSSGRYHLHPTRRSADPSRRSSLFIPKRSSSSRCFPNSPAQHSPPIRTYITR